MNFRKYCLPLTQFYRDIHRRWLGVIGLFYGEYMEKSRRSAEGMPKNSRRNAEENTHYFRFLLGFSALGSFFERGLVGFVAPPFCRV